MHRSSDSVASLAGALAKAQVELVNPEKSLTANIRSDRRGETERAFRYASLASGLDVVRKTLGKYELALIQSTAIDQPSGMVNLTTMVAHSSGEWISSDWPVCQIADVAVPHRMGAALTYARRYALFALVGIAGEDDLDAPDLNIQLKEPEHSAVRPEATSEPVDQPTVSPSIGSRAGPRHAKSSRPNGRLPILSPDQSATKREQLVRQIAGLSSAEEAIEWIRDALSIKNQLTATDAGLVEQVFGLRIAALSESNPTEMVPSSAIATVVAVAPVASAELPSTTRLARDRVGQVNRLDRAPPRRRDKGHLKYVAAQACLVCGRQPSDPHHLRFAQPAALGRKVSDEFTVPLCRSHHRELHRLSDEPTWWASFRIDPLAVAMRLWRSTHETLQVIDCPTGIAAPQLDTGRRSGSGNPETGSDCLIKSAGVKSDDVAKAD